MSSLERIMKNRSAELTTKPKIIVVDDELEIGEMLTKFLTKKNYEVTNFTSGKKALEHLKTHEVNLMLIDMNMPEMSRERDPDVSGSGIDLIKATKELKPDLPILVMTGMYGSELMNELVKVGITDYFAKPVQLDSLEKVIASRL